MQADNSITDAPVFSPVDGVPVVQLNSAITQSVGGADLAELDLCVFAEPGLHATDSAVYLTVYCADASTIPATGNITEYVVHFRCNSPCDMSSELSWEYLGRLLTPADAEAATGGHHYQAPSLLEKNGKTYLIVTTVDRTQTGDLYNGCRVYEFVDINSNQLVRDNNDKLEEVVSIEGEPGTHHGACAAYAGMDGGFYLSQLGALGTADAFSIYKSQIELP